MTSHTPEPTLSWGRTRGVGGKGTGAAGTTLTLLTNRIGHHAAHSGYDRLAAEMAATYASVTAVRPIDPPLWLRSVPGRAVLRKIGREWYSRQSLAVEAASARRLIDPRIGGGVHILWGDNEYAWSGYVPRHRSRKLIATFHQPPHILRQVGPSARALRRLDGAVVLCAHQADYLASVLPSNRVFRVPHGVDAEFFVPPTPSSTREQTCLVVGQWLRDQDMLEEACRALWAFDRTIEVRLVGSSPAVRRILESLPNVTCLPRISDAELLAEYQTAGVFLMPVTHATANCALLEALACGCPVVASDVGGISEYAGADGALLVKSADEMVDAAVAVLADQTRAVGMRLAARAAATRFAWPRVVADMASVYTEITQRPIASLNIA